MTRPWVSGGWVDVGGLAEGAVTVELGVLVEMPLLQCKGKALISVDVVVGDSGRIFVSNENEVVVMSPTIVLARVKAARVAILNETYMEGKKVIG